ncbi:MAG: hypothetical protein ACYDA1_03090 [Vulcanimicrobiaceae bacterium]
MRWRVDRQRLAGAIVASLVLHGLFASLLPRMQPAADTQPTLVTISFLRIEHPHPPSHPRAQPTPPPTPRPTPGQRRAELAIVVTHPKPIPVVGRKVAQRAATPRPQQPVSPVIATTPAAMASPAAAAAAVAAATPRPGVVGMLPFGADEKTPVLDPGVKRKLLALGVHVTLTVDVGDDGKTKHVRFAPPIDAATENEITHMLSDATWDPSYCGGGLPCAGTATITL